MWLLVWKLTFTQELLQLGELVIRSLLKLIFNFMSRIHVLKCSKVWIRDAINCLLQLFFFDDCFQTVTKVLICIIDRNLRLSYVWQPISVITFLLYRGIRHNWFCISISVCICRLALSELNRLLNYSKVVPLPIELIFEPVIVMEIAYRVDQLLFRYLFDVTVAVLQVAWFGRCWYSLHWLQHHVLFWVLQLLQVGHVHTLL